MSEITPLVPSKSKVITGVTHGSTKTNIALVTPKTKTEAFQENCILLLSELKDGIAQIQKTLQEEEEVFTDEEELEEPQESPQVPLKKKIKSNAPAN